MGANEATTVVTRNTSTFREAIVYVVCSYQLWMPVTLNFGLLSTLGNTKDAIYRVKYSGWLVLEIMDE